MIINGRDYKINILILLMEHEADVTVLAVETLLETIEEGVTISVLLNGGERSDLKELFRRSPHIFYYESKTNLGVAGGRNFLLEKKEARTADIIMFLDNDMIPTSDYVRGLATFLISSKNAGVVGSTMLNNPAVDRLLDKYAVKKEGVFGNPIRLIDNKKVKEILKKNFSKDLFYHIGSDPDWYNAYFSSKHFHNRFLFQRGEIKKRNFHTSLIDNNAVSLRYLHDSDERIEVSNIGGGTQTFFRRLISEIGNLNELFNPYGFEDVEFCVRAIRHGYKNYTDMGTFLIHDTGNKTLEKNHYRSLQKNSARNIINYKNMTFLYHMNFPDSCRELIYRRMFYEYFIDLLIPEEDALENIFYNMLGYLKATKQIRFEVPFRTDKKTVIYHDDEEINDLILNIIVELEEYTDKADEFSKSDLEKILMEKNLNGFVTFKIGMTERKRYDKKSLFKEILKAIVFKFSITRYLVYRLYRGK